MNHKIFVTLHKMRRKRLVSRLKQYIIFLLKIEAIYNLLFKENIFCNCIPRWRYINIYRFLSLSDLLNQITDVRYDTIQLYLISFLPIFDIIFCTGTIQFDAIHFPRVSYRLKNHDCYQYYIKFN